MRVTEEDMRALSKRWSLLDLDLASDSPRGVEMALKHMAPILLHVL